MSKLSAEELRLIQLLLQEHPGTPLKTILEACLSPVVGEQLSIQLAYDRGEDPFKKAQQ